MVVGGAGFIGSHLAEALASSGVDTVIYDDFSSGYFANIPTNIADVVVGRVEDTSALGEAARSSDFIFHLAAVSSVARCQSDISNSYSTNAGGVASAIQASARGAKRPALIFASSAAVYGTPASASIDENADKAPISFYGLAKLNGERLLQMASRHHQLRSVALRLFNVYGPRQDRSSPYSGVISLFADRLGKAEALVVYGDGQQTRDFIYVKDVVAHFLAAATMVQRPSFIEGFVPINVCTGVGTSINTLARSLSEIFDVPLRTIGMPPREADIRSSVGNNERAKELLSSPKLTALRDGLLEYVRAEFPNAGSLRAPI